MRKIISAFTALLFFLSMHLEINACQGTIYYCGDLEDYMQEADDNCPCWSSVVFEDACNPGTEPTHFFDDCH